MIDILLPATLAGYVVGVVLAVVGIVQRSRWVDGAASVVFTLTWALHTVTIVWVGVKAGHFPLSTGFEYLLVFGWAVVGLYLYIALQRRVPVAGLILPPLAALSCGAALAASPSTLEHGSEANSWFLFHTSIATLGMAILGVAFAMAVLYLAQDHALKSRTAPGLLQRLPPLEQCDRVGLEALIVGFALLTVGIGTGIVLNAGRYSQLFLGGPKQILPLIAWAVFLVVLLARTWLGYRGRRSAFLTIAGFLLALAGVAGMTL